MIKMCADRLVRHVLPTNWRARIKELLLAQEVAHLYGPKAVKLSKNEAAVTCVVKNGDYYLASFIKYYTKLGFRHIFFLDNGSSDDTISVARKYSNVTIYQSRRPIDSYQRLFKIYLARNCVVGGWCLDADIDEFFDYPYSDLVTLDRFIQYLNSHAYTAVVTQLLDMFPDEPLSCLEKRLSCLEKRKQEYELREIYQYYDISDIKHVDYQSCDLCAKYGYENEVSNNSTALYFGGIRRKLYGSNCLLTKHSFFLPQEGLDLFPHVHFINKARLADLSCVMLHYKLTGNALQIAIQNKDGFLTNAKGYDDFIAFLIDKPDCQIKQDGAVKLQSVNDLVSANFLFNSEQYCNYVKTVASQGMK